MVAKTWGELVEANPNPYFMRNPFVVLRSRGFVYEILGDTPTPALIDASNDGREHDAYRAADTGFWRLADPKNDRAGTEYTKVRVAHRPECPGERSFQMSHLMEWGIRTYGREQCPEHAADDGLLDRCGYCDGPLLPEQPLDGHPECREQE